MALTVPELVARTRAGDPRGIARLISLVENGAPELREAMATLAPHGGRACVVGLTGAPGVGKSTITSALVRAYRRRSARVGVLAVDPSSPFTGGAVLGDRIRMQEHSEDPGVFIRSMASRGKLGGLAASTPQALRVLDAAGFDVVLIETVGVGQSEIDIATLADTAVVLLAPGMGDAVQAVKAGILEVGDVYVVNKADHDGAHKTVRELRDALPGGHPDDGSWVPPVLTTVASRDEGIDGLVDVLDAHAAWLRDSGGLERRRRRRAVEEISAIALSRLRQRIDILDDQGHLGHLADLVAGGELDPFTAGDELLGAGAGAMERR